MNKPRFSHYVRCTGHEMTEEKCGHYTDGSCDLAEELENWENDPCFYAEWPQKPFNRYTALTYDYYN